MPPACAIILLIVFARQGWHDVLHFLHLLTALGMSKDGFGRDKYGKLNSASEKSFNQTKSQTS
jgi:hypothetical protein